MIPLLPVVTETGGDPEAIDFDDYYPSMADYYRALLGKVRT